MREQHRLGILCRIAGDGVELDLELALMGAVRVARRGLFDTADPLGHGLDDRQFHHRLGDAGAHAQALGCRRAGHGGHVNDKVAFLQIGQKGLAEEGQQRDAARGQQARKEDCEAWRADDEAQERFVAPPRPFDDRRHMRFGVLRQEQQRERWRDGERDDQRGEDRVNIGEAERREETPGHSRRA